MVRVPLLLNENVSVSFGNGSYEFAVKVSTRTSVHPERPQTEQNGFESSALVRVEVLPAAGTEFMVDGGADQLIHAVHVPPEMNITVPSEFTDPH